MNDIFQSFFFGNLTRSNIFLIKIIHIPVSYTHLIGIILAYWGLGVQSKMPFTVFGVAGVIITIISVILCVVIGLGIKRGKENIDKIIQLIKA